MQSAETSVAGYIKSLPPERAKVIRKIRSLINENLPKGYVEVMRRGMISWEVPLSTFPTTYNGEPISYVALAAQKNNYSIYLMGTYSDPEGRREFEVAFKESGKKLDMGKACVRFKDDDSLPLDVIGKTIKKYSVKKLIAQYESSRAN
jgi:uncharacterized protein YdhG (YjbR/CyaY superfamily)